MHRYSEYALFASIIERSESGFVAFAAVLLKIGAKGAVVQFCGGFHGSLIITGVDEHSQNTIFLALRVNNTVQIGVRTQFAKKSYFLRISFALLLGAGGLLALTMIADNTRLQKLCRFDKSHKFRTVAIGIFPKRFPRKA